MSAFTWPTALPCSTGDAATSEHSPSRMTVDSQTRLSPCTAAARHNPASLGYLIRASSPQREDHRV